jgi:hypothetical protein
MLILRQFMLSILFISYNMNVIDSRTVLDFQKFTFSGHLRQHVYKVLNENIKLGHADYACYWALELYMFGSCSFNVANTFRICSNSY